MTKMNKTNRKAENPEPRIEGGNWQTMFSPDLTERIFRAKDGNCYLERGLENGKRTASTVRSVITENFAQAWLLAVFMPAKAWHFFDDIVASITREAILQPPVLAQLAA
jgi:hypothetical protein